MCMSFFNVEIASISILIWFLGIETAKRAFPWLWYGDEIVETGDAEFETKRNNNWTKNKIELQS